MLIAAQDFVAQVEAAFSQSGTPSVAGDDVARAAHIMAEGAARSQGLVELERDDIRCLLADVPSGVWDVRIFEIQGPRAAPLDLAPWLHEVHYAVVEVAGGPDLTLHDVSATADQLYALMPAEVEVVFGAVVHPELAGRIQLRVVAVNPGAKTP